MSPERASSAEDLGARATMTSAVLPHVQGLRAIAVILVLIYHAGGPLPGGFVGVDMFFVISGYVITLVLLRELKSTGTVRLKRFYARRFRRLIPALAVVVVFTTALSLLLLSPLGPQETTALTGLGAMLFVANVVIARTTGDYFDAPAESNALLHTWSLSVEEQFYLVFPLFLLLAWRHLRTREMVILLLAAGAVISGAVALLGAHDRSTFLPESLVGFYGPVTRAWEFAAGALLALLLERGALRLTASRVTGLAGIVLILCSVAVIDSSRPFPSEWTLLPVVGTVLLIVGGGGWSTLHRFLSSRGMVWIGDRSYSLYLWHWPFAVFAMASFPGSAVARAVAVALSSFPAALSFSLVEQPLRRLAGPTPRRFAGLVLVTVAPVLVITGAVAYGATTSFGSDRLRELRSAAEDITPGCHTYAPLLESTADSCTWNAEGVGTPIYLFGDSHAKHLSTGVIDAGRALERPIVISTSPNCPLIDVVIGFHDAPGDRTANCRQFVDGTLAFISGAPAGTVILGASDLYWWDPEISVGGTSPNMSSVTDDKLALADSALTATVATIVGAGHDVILVQDIPRWAGVDAWDPTHCTGLQLILHGLMCRREMALERVDSRQGGVRPVMAAVAERTGSQVVDTWDLLCPEGVCRTWSGSITSYRDSNHLSVRQSAALAPVWVRELTNAEKSHDET